MNLEPRYTLCETNLKDLWVDPADGDDGRDGHSPESALRTLGAAWKRIPPTPGERGWRVRLRPGRYEAERQGQILLYDKRGSRTAPIVIQGEEAGEVFLPQVDVERCSHLALLNLSLRSSRASEVEPSHDNILHFGASDHLLVRGVNAIGEDGSGGLPRLAFKANQCAHLYVEDSAFFGSYAYAFAYVAVQHGHIVRSRFGRCGMNAVCLKGGSAYHLVAGNEIEHCAGVGINIGEGSGFAYLVEPWLQYEAYDIKVVNNTVHHAGGGLGVGGTYNALLAYNTCYHVGGQRDVIVVAFGGRAWVGGSHEEICLRYQKAGGWCSREPADCHIPSKNILIFNNLVLNPDGFESRYAHFGITGPVAPVPNGNLPERIAIEDLRIEGNLVWNGGPAKPVLDDVEHCYGLAARPTVHAEDLRAKNALNTMQPVLENPDGGDFRPRSVGAWNRMPAVPIPDFSYPCPFGKSIPPGDPDNRVPTDKDGRPRGLYGVGAYAPPQG